MSKQYPSTLRLRSGQAWLRAGRIGGSQARYKTIRESLTEAVQAPFRRAARLLRGQAYGAAEMDETIWALKDVSSPSRLATSATLSASLSPSAPRQGSGQAPLRTGQSKGQARRGGGHSLEVPFEAEGLMTTIEVPPLDWMAEATTA